MKKIIFLIPALVFSICNLFSQEDKMAWLLGEMGKIDKHANVVTFNFSQEILYTLTNEKQSVNGKIAFKKPYGFYFSQEKPVKQTVVANKKKVWIYTPTYNQVVVDSWKKWLNTSIIPSSLLSFSSDIESMKKDYQFTYKSEEENSYVISLKPMKKEGLQWEILMWINKKGFYPGKMFLKAENVQITTVCENYLINPEIDNSIFEFIVPKGVEVIEMP